MSFKARLTVDGNTYTVLEADYGFRRKTDAEGRPSTMARGGMVRLVIEATESSAFAEIACNSYLTKDVNITYDKRDAESKLKEVNLKLAYLVGYKEKYEANEENPLVEELIFSAHEITIGPAVHQNDWPDI